MNLSIVLDDHMSLGQSGTIDGGYGMMKKVILDCRRPDFLGRDK